ncbi:alpha-L-arabinofuranosidase II [Tothia fuscella]|uniref:Alpha-L-arabinofuranosidase II n=1 Tax=Tothia fuscella TaxID=1048955 RepID=A0A9P4TVV9_9PEZI|nr:alpha-L-arabinofuranosidase II [Tothia fuscella]
MEYNDALLTLSDTATPDPYVIFANGKYYMTYTAGDRVDIWSSNDFLSLGTNSTKHTIWRPPPHSHYSGDLWAPELHQINGRWFVYVSADDPAQGNKSHRMYVLGGPPSTEDPCDSTYKWEFLGPIKGLRSDQWAIDGTVITLNHRLYFIYSGWPQYNPHKTDLIQELFIVELSDATHAIFTPVRISRPDLPWEWSGDHGINEGPQFLASPYGNWIGISYSCAGSWTADYKINTLQYIGGNPLSPQAWRKGRKPLLKRNKHTGPYGPGHGNALNVDGETLMVFHATDRDSQGWEGRKARVQRVAWDSHGPSMGDGTVGRMVIGSNAFWHAGAKKKGESQWGFRGMLSSAFGRSD